MGVEGLFCNGYNLGEYLLGSLRLTCPKVERRKSKIVVGDISIDRNWKCFLIRVGHWAFRFWFECFTAWNRRQHFLVQTR